MIRLAGLSARDSSSPHRVEAPQVTELVQLVLLPHVHVAAKKVHLAPNDSGGVESASSRAHRCFVGREPGLLVTLQHHKVVQSFLAAVNAAKHNLPRWAQSGKSGVVRTGLASSAPCLQASVCVLRLLLVVLCKLTSFNSQADVLTKNSSPQTARLSTATAVWPHLAAG